MTYNFEQAKKIVEKYSHLIDNDKSFSDQTNRRYPISAVVMVPENKVAQCLHFYSLNKDNMKSLLASGWTEKDNVDIVVYHYDTYETKSRYIPLNTYLNNLGQGDIIIP